MNDAAAIEKVEQLVLKTTEVITIEGRKYTARELKRIDEPTWKPLTRTFLTLTGMVNFVLQNPDSVPEGVYFHVTDFDTVILVGPPVGERKEVTVYAEARSPVSQDFQFDKFMPVEEMVIKVRTLFEKTPDLDAIVGMMMQIDTESGISQIEDGVSQSLVVKKGISGVNKEPAINKGIFQLAPFRTFQEITQPSSVFLFRLKSSESAGAMAAIFSAGGQAWRLDAIQKIKVYLEAQTGGKFIVLA